MADVKISELTALTSANVDASGDVLAVVDTSATATRKITVENLLSPITINKATDVITDLGTVSGATSITSTAFVGPLTGDVTGNVSGTAPAGTLTGSTLASGVTASSLTSVGTLTALTGGTGDFNWDSNTLVVDSSESRVGIGVAAPNSLLHLERPANDVGGAKLTIDNPHTGDSDYGSTIAFQAGTGVNGTTDTNIGNITCWKINNSDGSKMRFQTQPSGFGGGATALTIDASQDVTFTGNVGIGVSPAHNLHIRDDSSDPNIMVHTENASLDPYLQLHTGSKVWSIVSDNSDSDSLKILSGGTGTIASDTAHITIAESAGDVTIGTGNLVIGTAGKGISFSSTNTPVQSSGTGTSNLLDDYEEGTWTPTMTSAAGTVTVASVTAATYTKIGRIVCVRARIDYSTDASVSTSVITFGGLPFTIKNDGGYSGARLTINNQNTAHNYDGSMFGTPNTTTISYQSRSTSMSSQTGAWLGIDMTYVT
jgi:hypothetical protein